ncbi:hypothetical protein P4161_08575 [Pseudomonas aeruginosa]|nr:hypothetical protein [Pseudomonas aeruginosa]
MADSFVEEEPQRQAGEFARMAIADGAAGPVGVVERRVLVAAPDLAVEVADELVRLAVANRARTEQFQGAEVDRRLVDGRWRRGPAKALRQDEAGEIDVLRRAFAAQVALTVGRGERIAPDHPLQSQFEQLIVRGLASLLQCLAVDVRATPRALISSPIRESSWPFSRLTCRSPTRKTRRSRVQRLLLSTGRMPAK